MLERRRDSFGYRKRENFTCFFLITDFFFFFLTTGRFWKRWHGGHNIMRRQFSYIAGSRTWTAARWSHCEKWRFTECVLVTPLTVRVWLTTRRGQHTRYSASAIFSVRRRLFVVVSARANAAHAVTAIGSFSSFCISRDNRSVFIRSRACVLCGECVSLADHFILIERNRIRT